MTEPVPVNRFRTMLEASAALSRDTDRILSGYRALARDVAANDTLKAHSCDNEIRGDDGLTAVERAADRNLGTVDDSRRHGPTLRAARMVHLVKQRTQIDHELLAIADSTERYVKDERQRCVGTGDTKGAACFQWADANRSDGRCIDCRAAVRAAYRAEYKRKHARRQRGSA